MNFLLMLTFIIFMMILTNFLYNILSIEIESGFPVSLIDIKN